MSAEAAQAREDAPIRRQAPTRRAALAGVIVAGVALALVFTAAFWERPAHVPTYAATDWSGEALEVAGYAQVASHGLFTACPTATLSDGTTAGLLLVDGWSASIPGIGAGGGGAVASLRGPDGLAVADGFDLGGDPIVGRMLDPGAPADAALADTWTAMCGAADSVVLVEPGSTVHFPTVRN
ncbi:hypothetical protein [Demequina soli]|uniref:hypothetical protein n=1 Tax=Demequina soli TaxID=1638987 RepID=UPI0007811DDE|nr:hypothetical protein [Demequina soli]